MATQEQLNTVRKLHEQNDRTLGGYADGQYNITNGTNGGGDPYEAYHAMVAGGLLTPDATVNIVTVLGLATPTVATLDGAGETYTSTVTFNDALGGEDETVTWSLGTVTGTGTYAISMGGVLTGTGVTTATDTFDVIATSNFDGTTIGTLTITVAV